MHKGGNFTIVSTTLLIGLNIKFYEIFTKQHIYHPLFSTNFLTTKSRLSLSNTEILYEEHVKYL